MNKFLSMTRLQQKSNILFEKCNYDCSTAGVKATMVELLPSLPINSNRMTNNTPEGQGDNYQHQGIGSTTIQYNSF